MIEFTTEIGTSEKHKIQFQFNQFWKSLLIKADGKTVAKKAMNLRFRENKEYEFEVGKDEKHEVRFELVRSLFPVGYGECTAWVFVDGEKTEEHTGKVSWKDKLFKGVGFLPAASIITAVILVLSILIGLIAYSIPIRINKTLDGVVIMTGGSMPEYIEHKEILIDGKYYRKIFTEDEFYGDIVIDTFLPKRNADDFPRDYYLHLNRYRDNVRRGIFFMAKDIPFSEGMLVRAGVIIIDPRGDRIMITLDEKTSPESHHWSSGNGLIFSAPAANREEALKIGNDFFISINGDDFNLME